METSAATISRAFIAESATLVDQAAELSGWDPADTSLERIWHSEVDAAVVRWLDERRTN